MKSIVKFAVIFIISFICFNQGMNDFFENYIPTRTNIIMIVAPIVAVTMVMVDELLKQLELEYSENESEDI